jgi:hypothetical protein
MYELIVLGLIPGTNIQINFYFWLVLASGSFALFAARRMSRSVRMRQLLTAYWIAVRIKRAVRAS